MSNRVQLPLSVAAMDSQSAAMVKLLLKHNANPNPPRITPLSLPPLFYAVRDGSPASLVALISALPSSALESANLAAHNVPLVHWLFHGKPESETSQLQLETKARILAHAGVPMPSLSRSFLLANVNCNQRRHIRLLRFLVMAGMQLDLSAVVSSVHARSLVA